MLEPGFEPWTFRISSEYPMHQAITHLSDFKTFQNEPKGSSFRRSIFQYLDQYHLSTFLMHEYGQMQKNPLTTKKLLSSH